VGAQPAEQETNAPIRVAFSSSFFVDVNENDAGAAVRVWAQVLGRDHGIPVDPVVKIFRGTNAIIEVMRSHVIDMITVTTDELWALRKEVAVGSFVYGVKGGKIQEQYVLLVHRDSGIERLADLRGRALVLFQNPRASLAPMWLDTLLAQEGQARLAAHFGQVVQCTKPSRAILPVFFRQSDACLVTRQGFETTVELNPQIGRQLKVLACSPDLVPALFCFRNDYQSPWRNKLLAEIEKMHTTPAGHQVMNLFQCDRISEGPESNLNSAFELLAAYHRLEQPSNHLNTATPPTQPHSPQQ
jgi:ABC-type phosphate/phosphonate transport system substrate-binding protein